MGAPLPTIRFGGAPERTIRRSRVDQPYLSLRTDLAPLNGEVERGASGSVTLPLRGRVGPKGRGGVIPRILQDPVALLHSGENGVQNGIKLRQNLVVPEAYHTVSRRFQESGAFNIISESTFLCMLTAVQLDHQADLMTGEVHKIGADRHLTAKVCTVNRNAPQMPPKASLGIRHRVAQTPGICPLEPVHRRWWLGHSCPRTATAFY